MILKCKIEILSVPIRFGFDHVAWITHQTNQIIYVRGDILDEKDQLTVTGQGVFRMVKTPSRKPLW